MCLKGMYEAVCLGGAVCEGIDHVCVCVCLRGTLPELFLCVCLVCVYRAQTCTSDSVCFCHCYLYNSSV